MLFACLLCWGSSAPADDEISPAQADFFEAKIRPVLIERCYECHSEAADTSEGGLYVDSQQGLRIGGSGGAAVVPGKPDDSVLLKAITYQHEELQMPPEEAGGKLSDDVIDDFRTWISMGSAGSSNDRAGTAGS